MSQNTSLQIRYSWSAYWLNLCQGNKLFWVFQRERNLIKSIDGNQSSENKLWYWQLCSSERWRHDTWVSTRVWSSGSNTVHVYQKVSNCQILLIGQVRWGLKKGHSTYQHQSHWRHLCKQFLWSNGSESLMEWV